MPRLNVCTGKNWLLTRLTAVAIGATVFASPALAATDGDAAEDAAAAHEELFAEAQYPSASTCGTCHPKHFREWSASQHAYAQLSPVYLSLSNKINELSNGSNGDFCLRCHNQVGANLGEDQFASNLTRHPTSREGITCVVCHRIVAHPVPWTQVCLTRRA